MLGVSSAQSLHPQVLEGTRCWRGFEGLGQPFVGHSRFWPVLPRAAPSVGVVICTYEQRFRPLNCARCYCDSPVSDCCMQHFLLFRLGFHGLPVAVHCLLGAGQQLQQGRASNVVGILLRTRCIWILNVLILSH